MSVWDSPTEESVFGPETPFEGVVKEAKFYTDPRYRDGEVVLMGWTLETDSTDPDFEEFDVSYSCGNGWETNDNGKTAEHVNNKDKFNSQSAYGLVLQRVVGKNPELKDEFKGLVDILAERGDPREAKIWEGLRFRFDVESREYNFQDGPRTVSRIMPVEFLGVEDDGKKKAPAKKKSGGGKKKAKSLRDQVVEAAKNADDHEDFMAAAFAIEGVTDDDDLVDEISDEDGIWAEVHGE